MGEILNFLAGLLILSPFALVAYMIFTQIDDIRKENKLEHCKKLTEIINKMIEDFDNKLKEHYKEEDKNE